ncbi:sister chromatid cohesion protein DCC1 isoform X1 [Palaemon carinicauda]|uniref:sister chromatid cohesion protein DCC1 isoform X1 n=1 Tax=Palaemon carinicauda TaxID=392227 RepID=UPI0035B57C78
MSCIDRSVDDVKKLIHHAKLTNDELLPVTQTLEFTENYGEGGGKTLLFEANSELLETLKKGDRLIFRGDPEAGAVLCTKNKTYEVRDAETSNSLVLLPEFTFSDSMQAEGERSLINRRVKAIHHSYLEVRPCKPRLQKLRQMLNERPFNGDQEMEGERYCLNDLLDRVQCSEEELDQALLDVEAYHLYGFWQILDFDYRFKVVSDILNLIETNKWPLDNVPRIATIRVLSESEPRAVISQCFEYYLKPTGNITDEGDELYTLNDDKVCRLCAEVLLKPAGKFNLNDFLTIWQQSVPEGLTTNLAQLEGIALVDRSCTPEIISHFPACNLTEDIQERFAFLFETKDKWTFDEIRPYIEDLATNATPVSALLTKYARASTKDGIKYYTGRHVK